jgi:hypothetical protein
MVKNIHRTLASLERLTRSNGETLSYLQDLILSSASEIAPASNKILFDLAQLEEIALLVSTLVASSDKQSRQLTALSSSFDVLYSMSDSIKLLKIELNLLQTSYRQSSSLMQKTMHELLTVHKEYKTRCQTTFLDYLKGVDIDLRKILKPLVPSSVIKEQVKFPLINSNSSLCSSVQSINESIAGDSQEEVSVKSQPEPAEMTVQKLNTHIQMLVGTLENIAKDLIQVLAEADREYYQLLNNIDVYSRPPTPLAAPLPDYFCYELQETPNQPFKPILTTESKEIWLHRLHKLHNTKSIKESLYKSLVVKLKKSNETKKLNLKELFENTDISVTERENLVYYLINGSTEFERHVSLSQILSETKLKPEPPKNPKPKAKAFHKMEKEQDRRASPINPDHEVARISQASMYPQAKVINSIRLGSKSPKVQRLFNNRKSVRVRSITPVEKEKMLNTKARTPSVQNKVTFSTIHPKHRLRKNL